MSNSFTTQVAMAILAVGMLFFYVKPAFVEIGIIQDEIVQYQQEREKVNEVNSRLNELVNSMNTITAINMKALVTFMPDTINHVAIARDIFYMSEQAGIYLDDVTYTTVPRNIGTEDINAPFPHAFSVSVTGTYAEVKSFLSRIESNNYPLEVYEFKISSTELNELKAELLLITYSHYESDAGTLAGNNRN